MIGKQRRRERLGRRLARLQSLRQEAWHWREPPGYVMILDRKIERTEQKLRSLDPVPPPPEQGDQRG